MTKEDVYEQSLKLLKENEIGMYPDSTIFYRFNTKNYILWNWVEFYYHDGKLWRIVESVLPNKNEPKNSTKADFIEDVLLDTKNNFGEDPRTNGTQTSKFYWLKKNVRIDYYEENNANNIKTTFVAYTDIPMERIIKEEMND